MAMNRNVWIRGGANKKVVNNKGQKKNAMLKKWSYAQTSFLKPSARIAYASILPTNDHP
ncbi:MAG: hypothetical protein ACLPX5_05930 [Dissulfurispiraceae bacterium]